jgi:hypothetical protein
MKFGDLSAPDYTASTLQKFSVFEGNKSIEK